MVDSVSRFLAQRCKVGGGNLIRVPTTVVTQAYRAWCHETASPVMSNTAFGRAMRQLGITRTRSHGCRFYTGLALR